MAELAELHTYLRIRMSLLADMATNDPVASIPTYLNQEVLQAFRQQKLLLAYLIEQIVGQINPETVAQWLKKLISTSENTAESLSGPTRPAPIVRSGSSSNP